MESFFSYNIYGQTVRAVTGKSETFATYNRYGDILASWKPQVGITLLEYSPTFKREKIYHQFDPQSISSFAGTEKLCFKGKYFLETICYDSLGRISSITSTDQPINGKLATISYSRYPNGKINKITDATGLSRIDEYGDHGLLTSQTLWNNNLSAKLNSDFCYFPDGQIKSFSNLFGEVETNGLDIYGRMSTHTDSLGRKTVKRYNALSDIVDEHTEANGKIISRKSYEYNGKGLLENTYVFRYLGEKCEKILARKLKYDAVANVIASRGIQENSWEYFLYDGLNRTIVHKNAVADIKVSIYDGDLLMFSQQLNLADNNAYRCQGKFFVFDKAGNVTATVPTDTKNLPVLEKVVLTKYDIAGNVILYSRPNLNAIEKKYDTLRNVIQESIIPSSCDFGEKEAITRYIYSANGRLDKKIVENNSLAIYGSKDDAKATLISAPQETIYSYDELGRQSSIRQPDGLIVEKRYDSHSMPIEMIWSHATATQTVLRHLRLSFGKQGRLLALIDAKTGTVLRKYSYDIYGNRILEVDGNVSTHRKYDSLGMLLEEKTEVADHYKLPWFSKKYELIAGKESIAWNALPPIAPENWKEQIIYRDALGRVKNLRLDKSQVDFATWKYIGEFPSERILPESQIRQKNIFNNCNELTETRLFNEFNQFGTLSYQYDKKGNLIYSSTELAQNSTEPYTYAQYMGYNSLQQLVAQNGETNIPNPKDALERREQLLGQQSLHSSKTSRMVFDQVDNFWARYHGKRRRELKPEKFTKDNLSSFTSAAKILPSKDNISQSALFELTSNRETTQAYFTDKEKLIAKENTYDNLGNLVEYDGKFWNGERSFAVRWTLAYDELGRLLQMNAHVKNEGGNVNTGFLKNGELAANLVFCYDASNRRIRKTVKDYTRYKNIIETNEWTVFIDNNQAIVLSGTDDLSMTGQYLWTPDSRELLMAALPQNIAENIERFSLKRYYFQQDRSLNTVCVTTTNNGKLSLISGASYLCFGKNATSAKIKDIRSSMADVKRSFAANNNLDDVKPATWSNESRGWQFIEMKLNNTADLTSLNIWTNDSFPKKFFVFVLPPAIESPKISDDMSVWMQNAISSGGFAYNFKSESAVIDSKPVSVPLLSLRGNRVVIVWDKHEKAAIEVKEFEIYCAPNNPGAIAFAGQWLDRETNMYYQINRYKLAGANKFISPDPIGFLDGNNPYAYAKNNPLEWHDPNGEWVHIVLGAIGGALINSGVYAVQCWITGEDFSWKELAIKAGTGAFAGGIAAATFGAVNPLLADWGLNATANIILSAGTAGFTSGFSSGMANSLLQGNTFGDAALTGLKSGGWGAAGGALGGGVLSFTGASLGGTLLSGGISGGVIGGIQSGGDAYQQTGDWDEALWAGLDGSWKGAAFGSAIAGAGWKIGKATGRIQKLQKYPEDLPDPRKSIMIKTKVGERIYDGMNAKPGHARHHITPLSLGGRDVRSNLEYVPENIHRQPHPGSIVNATDFGTIFY